MGPAEGVKLFVREIPGAIPLQRHFYENLTEEAAHRQEASAHQLPGKIARRLPCQPRIDRTLSPATRTHLGKNDT
jgi:hypothetical protein